MFLDVFFNVFILLLIVYLIINLFDKNKTLEWKFVNFVNNSYDWVANKLKNIWAKLKQ